jgi:putative methionine-R-sulfoxide reductase with GAF domain
MSEQRSGPVVADGADAGLGAWCAVARWCFQAAAVSVAIVDDDALHYVAADGAGAAAIVGARLEAGRGIAGFAAATGQSLVVRDVASDARHARDVGEVTGYLPNTIHCVPVDGIDGDVAAVVSILDRAESAAGSDAPAVPLERLTDVLAPMLGRGDDQGTAAALAERLAHLAPDRRDSAMTAVSALLDALER